MSTPPTPSQPSSAFTSAASYAASSPSLKKLSTETKLRLYALYKLSTASRTPDTPRPGILDFAGRAKWDAWAAAGKEYAGKSAAEIEAAYIDLCASLGWKEGEVAFIGDGKEERGGGTGMGVSVSVLERDEAEHAQEEEDSLAGAAVRNDIARVREILDGPGVEIDALDTYGFTALHLAADRGYAPIVKLLLDKGANVGVKDPDGETAISLAKAAGHEEIAVMIQQILLNHGRDGQDV